MVSKDKILGVYNSKAGKNVRTGVLTATTVLSAGAMVAGIVNGDLGISIAGGVGAGLSVKHMPKEAQRKIIGAVEKLSEGVKKVKSRIFGGSSRPDHGQNHDDNNPVNELG